LAYWGTERDLGEARWWGLLETTAEAKSYDCECKERGCPRAAARATLS